MPLRDHFRPPLSLRHPWTALHAGWPMVIVQHLDRLLPEGYVAAPGVYLGSPLEIDVGTLKEGDRGSSRMPSNGDGGVATATLAPPRPTVSVTAELPDPAEFEVRIYDEQYGRRLVAAIEIISPANKDRPASRLALVTKVTALLREGVCVSLIDLVTDHRINLYGELLEHMHATDSSLGETPPWIYAVTLRNRGRKRRNYRLDVWNYPLAVGTPLPQLPIWLDAPLGRLLDLEAPYEEACRTLRMA